MDTEGHVDTQDHLIIRSEAVIEETAGGSGGGILGRLGKSIHSRKDSMMSKNSGY